MAKARVIVVEDEFLVGQDIQARLEGMGYQVTAVVASGDEALSKADQDDVDLVLMDIRLRGDMDGIETAERIRSRSGLPVIYLTAFADEAMLERAKATEPFGYLLKPFEDRELDAVIQVALYKAKMEAERRRLILELQEALTEVKKLSGLVPICASCKKIRNDEGYWQQLEKYIQEHSEARFSHGICPECARKLYPELYQDDL